MRGFARTFGEVVPTADSASGGFVCQILLLPVTPAVGQQELYCQIKLCVHLLNKQMRRRYAMIFFISCTSGIVLPPGFGPLIEFVQLAESVQVASQTILFN